MARLMKLNSFWQGIIVSTILVIIFLYSTLLHLGTPIDMTHGDAFHAMLTMKHLMDTIIKGDWKNVLQMPTFYGFPDSYLYSELFIFESVSALPFYLISGNIIFTYNLVGVLTVAASCFSMFIFAKYITGKFWPAVLASIIYVFNPFTIGHYPDNIHYYSLEWLPLIFLYLEKFMKDHSNKNSFLFFLFLTMQSLTSLSFGALLTIILPIYSLVRVIQLKLIKKPDDIMKFVNIGAITGLILFAGVNINIYKVYNIYFAKEPIVRDIEETSTFAPWAIDLFQTSPSNLLYGWTRTWTMNNLPNAVFHSYEHIERDLFWGITVWILILISFFTLKKSKESGIWSISMTIFILCILLSLGPRIRFTQDFSIPGIYNIFYKINPLLQDLRVSSRFAFVGFMFLGLICAIVVSKKSKFFSYIVIGLVILEYINIPWNYEPIPENIKNFYSIINKDTNIHVLLELPMGNLFTYITLADNQFIESNYMLYANSLHSKSLLNGYSSYTPVKYPARIEYLSVFFPTSVKLNQLRKWGVDAIALHRDAFKDPSFFYQIETGLKTLGIKEIYKSDGLALFKL